MTRANQWLIFGGVISVGAGFLGGMMFRRRSETHDRMMAIGQLYEVDTETYADSGLAEFLIHRADSSDVLTAGKWAGWTVLRFRAAAIFIKKLHDGRLFTGQRGALYTVRAEHSTASDDPQVKRFLQTMIDLGLVGHGGRWQHWGDVFRISTEVKGSSRRSP